MANVGQELEAPLMIDEEHDQESLNFLVKQKQSCCTSFAKIVKSLFFIVTFGYKFNSAIWSVLVLPWIFFALGMGIGLTPLSIDIYFFIIYLGFAALIYLGSDFIEADKSTHKLANLTVILILAIFIGLCSLMVNSLKLGFIIITLFLMLLLIAMINMVIVKSYLADNKQLADKGGLLEKFFTSFDVSSVRDIITSFDDLKGPKRIRVRQLITTLDFAFSIASAYIFFLIMAAYFVSFPYISDNLGTGSAIILSWFDGNGYLVSLLVLGSFNSFAVLKKIGVSYYINQNLDLVKAHFESLNTFLRVIISTPETVLQSSPSNPPDGSTEEVWPNDDQSVLSNKVLFKTTWKISRLHGNAVKGIQTGFSLPKDQDINFGKLKADIKKQAKILLKRCEAVRDLYRLNSKLIEYKFMGIFKVDKALVLSITTAVGVSLVTVIGSYLKEHWKH